MLDTNQLVPSCIVCCVPQNSSFLFFFFSRLAQRLLEAHRSADLGRDLRTVDFVDKANEPLSNSVVGASILNRKNATVLYRELDGCHVHGNDLVANVVHFLVVELHRFKLLLHLIGRFKLQVQRRAACCKRARRRCMGMSMSSCGGSAGRRRVCDDAGAVCLSCSCQRR